MAFSPKPVVLTQEDTNPSSFDPEPLVIIGSFPVAAVDLTAVAGYDAGQTQTLKHVSGVLTWVTDV